MTEKRFGIIKTKTYGLYVPVDKMKVYNFSSFEDELDCIRVVNALNGLEEKSRENDKIASKYLNENELLKKQIEEYTNPDKYILIKKTESSTEEYNSCPDCQHYEREYEEIIAFGEYETLTKEICNKGHDIEDTDANKCNDYEYNEF